MFGQSRTCFNLWNRYSALEMERNGSKDAEHESWIGWIRVRTDSTAKMRYSLFHSQKKLLAVEVLRSRHSQKFFLAVVVFKG